MADYAFRTLFELTAPQEAVFEAVLSPARWLTEMAHVRSLEPLATGDADGQGARYRTTVSAVSPYQLRWDMEAVRVAAPELIEWRAEGDLAGEGAWEVHPVGAGSRVVSTARLRTTRWWMALLEPIARPLFVRNHDLVMRAGVDALAAHLGAAVTRYESGDLLTSGR